MPPAQYALFEACRTLFGDEVQLGPEFLDYLQPSGAKSAFRNQAKRHHPDRFAGATQDVRARQAERFREIRQAYNLLNDFLARRCHQPRPSRSSVAPIRPQRPSPPATPGEKTPMPPLPMAFGTFAFHQGKIDYRDLIEALVWQRRQRPAIGTIACQWGWLSDTGVRRILGHRGHSIRFGQKAVELGLLSPLQVEALLLHQRTHQRRLGQYFIERGLMTAAEADELADHLARHNARCAQPSSASQTGNRSR